jgi:hypothetical protein
MSKRLQQKQSAFDRGAKIGAKIARTWGALSRKEYNRVFLRLYREKNQWYPIIYGSSLHAYKGTMKQIIESKKTLALITKLTGE